MMLQEKEGLTDFNDISTCLGFIYAEKQDNCINFEFIFTYSVQKL